MAHETLGEPVHLGAWIDLDLTVNHLTSGDEFPTPHGTKLHFSIFDPAVLTQSKLESTKELFHSGATIKADAGTQEPSITWDEPPHYSFENLLENQTIRILLMVGEKTDRQAEFHVTTHTITSWRSPTNVNIVCANKVAGKPTLQVTLTKYDRRGVTVKFKKATEGSKQMTGVFEFQADICGAPNISSQKIFLLSGMTYDSKESGPPNHERECHWDVEHRFVGASIKIHSLRIILYHAGEEWATFLSPLHELIHGNGEQEVTRKKGVEGSRFWVKVSEIRE